MYGSFELAGLYVGSALEVKSSTRVVHAHQTDFTYGLRGEKQGAFVFHGLTFPLFVVLAGFQSQHTVVAVAGDFEPDA